MSDAEIYNSVFEYRRRREVCWVWPGGDTVHVLKVSRFGVEEVCPAHGGWLGLARALASGQGSGGLRIPPSPTRAKKPLRRAASVVLLEGEVGGQPSGPNSRLPRQLVPGPSAWMMSVNSDTPCYGGGEALDERAPRLHVAGTALSALAAVVQPVEGADRGRDVAGLDRRRLAVAADLPGEGGAARTGHDEGERRPRNQLPHVCSLVSAPPACGSAAGR